MWFGVPILYSMQYDVILSFLILTCIYFVSSYSTLSSKALLCSFKFSTVSYFSIFFSKTSSLSLIEQMSSLKSLSNLPKVLRSSEPHRFSNVSFLCVCPLSCRLSSSFKGPGITMSTNMATTNTCCIMNRVYKKISLKLIIDSYVTNSIFSY